MRWRQADLLSCSAWLVLRQTFVFHWLTMKFALDVICAEARTSSAAAPRVPVEKRMGEYGTI